MPWLTASTGRPAAELRPVGVDRAGDRVDRGRGWSRCAATVAARPLWTQEDERIWARKDAKLGPGARSDGAGSNAFENPPLYYLAAAVPLRDRRRQRSSIASMRCACSASLLLLATVALTWLLAGVVFGGRREAQLVAAVAVGLQPVLLDMTTRVTPDALLIPLCAAALYLMALLAARGWSWPRVGAAGAGRRGGVPHPGPRDRVRSCPRCSPLPWPLAARPSARRPPAPGARGGGRAVDRRRDRDRAGLRAVRDALLGERHVGLLVLHVAVLPAAPAGDARRRSDRHGTSTTST